jgi:hypothetical protein
VLDAIAILALPSSPMEHRAEDGARAGFVGAKRIYRVGQRRELFGSVLLRSLFHGFLSLGSARRYAYGEAAQRELTAKQPRDTPSRKVAEAIRVLREAATLDGAPPSIKRFESLRKQHPEWRWPPAGTVRHARHGIPTTAAA